MVRLGVLLDSHVAICTSVVITPAQIMVQACGYCPTSRFAVHDHAVLPLETIPIAIDR